jgi:hypothetical protein
LGAGQDLITHTRLRHRRIAYLAALAFRQPRSGVLPTPKRHDNRVGAIWPPGVLARAYSMVYTFTIPEPMSLPLLALGGLAAARRRLA